ncbi:MAG: hypothetical protein QM703_17215 [Gemmatales bacterium]
MFYLKRMLTLLCVLAISTTPSWGAVFPSLQGSYLGGFQLMGTSAPVAAILPYIEQDNLGRLTSEIALAGTTPQRFPMRGTISPSGICTIVGTNAATPLVLHTTWEKFSYGAGGLYGSGTLPLTGGKKDGALFFFRPMQLGNTPRPNVRGNFAGGYQSNTGAAGTVTAQISDGTSNTFTVKLSFTQGQQTVTFASLGDVAPDGTFAGMGVSPDGSIAVIHGYIEQDNLRRPTRFVGTVEIKSVLGKPSVTNSIIAILIG